MHLDVFTIFPEYLAPLDTAILGRAQAKGLLSAEVHDLRQWARGVHRSVDDTPYGGGPGMVMTPAVWWEALSFVLHLGPVVGSESVPDSPSTDSLTTSNDGAARPLLLVPSPAGVRLTQELATQLSGREHLVFACGRYEGIDQRVFDAAAQYVDVLEVSLGDYVLIGGEVAVLAIAESVVRLIPGVLGNQRSHEEDSFSDGLLEGPSYTRPEVWEGRAVPEVLSSGNHGKIARWRRDQALVRTAVRRPDLLVGVQLDQDDRAVLRAVGYLAE